ncbi:Inosine/uridine-preferring nucleoside hydrolase [Sistotremastrum suecicum HHB10207 ss-3]|uniref:Inosine/uridine-preferring nucleoside hydrolase n=1 Tax=Sistotremastrum suecicum HHB10207 ss-3 TaxID=1314776 RepID=A0A165XXU1_9AGAM|nr:Inosine/uridine-preferring nucleoside hydrolase [Sistotremastrum suecicum HHB10207 ss-3]
MSKTKLWLDVDPGHDDAMAIMLAIHSPELDLLGISTVHGNAPAEHTHQNACRLIYAFGGKEDLNAYPGATKPLVRHARYDPEIHGEDGLGGVEGLPSSEHPAIRAKIDHGKHSRALEAMASTFRQVKESSHRLTVATCGPLTNLALLISTYPELLDVIERLVFMGGGVGMGNRSSVAEWNILCDPEAAQIVLDAPIEKVMIPINVTHTVIFDHLYHSLLLSPTSLPSFTNTLPEPETPLRHTLSTLLNFFAQSYREVFGFQNGPPLHDALTIAYIVNPELFTGTRYRVDVELEGKHTVGETVVDMWDYKKCDHTWGREGKNCIVTQSVDVEGFFELFLGCIDRCDDLSPLNRR